MHAFKVARLLSTSVFTERIKCWWRNSLGARWQINMLFLTNELAKKAEITILSARKSTRPGLQAGASWVERKPFKRKGIVRDSHLGL